MFANPDAVFNLESIKTVRSADEMPPILGPLRDRWTLAFRSGSPQSDDYRVLAFAPEAMTVVAYTGCPIEVKGKFIGYPKELYPQCEQIEALRLTYPDEKIVLKAYRLPGRGRDLDQYPVKVTGDNPSGCLSCHGQLPNVRFDPYNSWGGFFGGRSRDGEDIMRKGSKEHQYYDSFVDRIFKNPDEYRRYTGLSWRLNDSLRPQAIEPDRLQYYLDRGEIPLRIRHAKTTQPNPELNKMFSRWRGRMLIKRMTASLHYSKIKYAMLATALQCHSPEQGSITRFLPPSMTKASFQTLRDRILKEIEIEKAINTKDVREENPFDDEGRYRLVGAFPNGDRTREELIRLAYLWQAMGFSFDNWSGSANQKFNFNEGESAVGPIFKTFVDYIAKCDPELADYSKLFTYERFAGVLPAEDLQAATLRDLCQILETKGQLAR